MRQLEIQRELAQYIVHEVFNTITEEDVLKQDKDGWTYKGNHLTEGQLKILKKDAEALEKSLLYKILLDELNWFARQRLEKSATEQDMICAKLLSYFVDVIETKIRKISTL